MSEVFVTTKERRDFVAQRGELMAELFLRELDPQFLTHGDSGDQGFDFYFGIPNSAGGVNSFAVVVQSTERPVDDSCSIPRERFRRLANSNVPVLLLVIDVKHNNISYAVVRETDDISAEATTVKIPVTRIDRESQRKVKQELGRLGA